MFLAGKLSPTGNYNISIEPMPYINIFFLNFEQQDTSGDPSKDLNVISITISMQQETTISQQNRT